MLRKTGASEKLLIAFLGLSVFLMDFDGEGPGILPPLPSQAEAIIGRPWTPLSVGGVARRTTRRVIRRSAIYVNTLPRSCTSINVDGVSVWSCGGTYYQPYGNQFVVVYID